ncbi:hypothetical protein Btru_054018 [Bulinus truncatus]|nr:hypothetical protein Btru_054018 [Bulinus truncatus]
MDTNQPRSSHRGHVSSRGHNARSIKCPLKVLPLDSEEMYVSKAVKCFEESANISFGDNSPALYNLGLILRACGKHREAEKQFNKIINSNQTTTQDRSVYFDCMMTVMCAYEQSGLCLMDCVNGNNNLSEPDKNKMLQMSEQKLLTVVSLVASFVNIDPEIKPHAHNIWNSFRTLENRFEEDDSPPKIKKLIKLLHIACQYDKIPAVIEKLKSLSETELSDWRVIKAALESYLALQDYESAFTFLAVSMTKQPENCSELDSLKLKVQLCTAESRLHTDTASAKFILKPLFYSIVKSQPPKAVEVKDVQDHHDEYDDTIDVLILWDDTSPASDDLRVKVCLLQKCISVIFGLEVSVNLEKTNAPRQHVTVGLVDPEAIIHPHLKNYAHTPLQLVLKHLSEVSFYDDSDLSGELVEEQKESLVNDISSFSKMSLTSSECPVTNWSIDDADIVTSLMTLYCSLIEEKWPLNI